MIIGRQAVFDAIGRRQQFEDLVSLFKLGTVLTGSLIRPILALDRLSFLEAEGRVGYRHGEKGAELEKMDYLEFIARVTSHIPD